MKSGDFLAGMAESSRLRVAFAKEITPESVLRERIATRPAAVELRLSSAGFDLIAEMKLRSPALGALQASTDFAAEARIDAYADGGAAAISVLTEPTRFDGALDHLQQAAARLEARGPRAVPAMRKDFLVDPYQVLEARAAGAGGVLLIVRMLSRDELEALLEVALAQGLFVLLEAFDEHDIEAAIALLEPRQADMHTRNGGLRLLLGVNCRDLVSLKVIPDRFVTLAPYLPGWIARVAESGVLSAADAAAAAAAGYDLALVGGALMTHPTPQHLVEDMLQSGRTARGHRARTGLLRSA
ncbi:MAG: indole-3-glycerol-phosphate synthase TrpC [Sinobacteraceae bacterium]|nr:indole-3-glycerol-phosphate synthase TrpC [Nevskiaceae bacterium]